MEKHDIPAVASTTNQNKHSHGMADSTSEEDFEGKKLPWGHLIRGRGQRPQVKFW